MNQFRKRGLLACVLAAATWACEEGTGPVSGGGVSDDVSPTVSVVLADSLININEGLQFTLRGNDNISLLTIGWTITGAVTRDTLITFTTTTQTFQETFSVTEGFTGGTFTIIATATDGAGNAATPDTATARVFDAVAPEITLITPVAGAQVTTGATLDVIVSVTDPSGVSQLIASLFGRDQFSQPVDIIADTVNIATTPLPAILEDTLSFIVPNSLLPGTYEVRVFAVDGATPARSGFSDAVNISVLDGIAPGGSFISPAVDSIVIAGDPVSVRFRATDLTGVDSVRFTAMAARGVDSLGTSTAVQRYFEKTAIINQSRDTSIVRILAPVLTDSTPEQVTITGTVYDVGGTAVSINTTIQVVAGPRARIVSPADGSTHPVGTPLVVNIDAFSPDSLTSVFVTATGVVTATDTLAFTSPLSLTSITPLSLTIPNDANLGTVTVIGFATDNVGKLIPTDTITVTLTDTQAPSITFTLPDTTTILPVRVTDSVRVMARVQDNKGVTSVTIEGVAHRGDPTLGTDSLVQRFDAKEVTLSQHPDTLLVRDLLATPGDSTEEFVYIRVIAQDSSGNIARDSARIDVVQGPDLSILAPGDSSIVAPGKDITLQLRGESSRGMRRLGYITTGVLAVVDTGYVLATTNPQAKVADSVFTLSVPVGTALGFFTITPFGRDSTGKVGTGDAISVQVVADPGSGDTTPPLVTDSLGLRTESDDSIKVRATDVGGIQQIGFTVLDLSVSPPTTLFEDSALFGGTGTDVATTFGLGGPGGIGLDSITRFPLEMYVTAYAIDNLGNRGVLSKSAVALSVADGERADTATLVAGHTFNLPQGGTVADAIYNRNRNEVYLTNVDLDQVEVFDIASKSFKDPVPVGSRPWGIALWPTDTTGTHADTIVVANSGGTNLSIVDMSVSPPLETRRHALPNFIIHRVLTDPTELTGDNRLRLIVEEHDFSDRPQFLGMTCRPTDGQLGTTPATSLCASDSIIAVYSTTPTIDQGATFESRGSVRWENLTACKAVDPVFTGENCTDGPLVQAWGWLTLTAPPANTETVTIDGKTYTFQTSLSNNVDGNVWIGTTVATGTLTLTANAANGETVTIGGKTYTFQTVLTNVNGNVLIGGTADASLANLIDAINLGPTAGTDYAAATTLHPTVSAADGTGTTMVVTANATGSSGNTITTTETSANGSWGSGALTGGSGSAQTSVNNLLDAINLDGGTVGTAYAAVTTLHPSVVAGAAGSAMFVTAKKYCNSCSPNWRGGTAGNAITTTEALTNGSWGGATLSGGVGTGEPESHFFFESATRLPGEGADTLQIILHRARQTTVVLSAARVETVDFPNLGFRDTTFVRNSGNFRRALIGEGGDPANDKFARVVAYNPQASQLTLQTDTLVILADTLIGQSIVDSGLSLGIEVRDFISNTATKVRSIGINFNGLTNMVRADSIYVLNKFLRLTGITGDGGENAGMDLNFAHDFDASSRGTSNPDVANDRNRRFLFGARDDANIGVFDTWWFERVALVPIRDPVVGPLRVAEITATSEQLLIGVTDLGVVMVRLPAITNTFPLQTDPRGRDQPDR